MSCEWNPNQKCQLAGYVGDFSELSGKSYCSFHLPLESELKLDHQAFAIEFSKVREAGARDFSGIAFPGRRTPADNPTYRIGLPIKLRQIRVGEGTTIAFDNVGCDLSEATFENASTLQVSGSSNDRVLCKDATMADKFTFEGTNGAPAVAFDGSKFGGPCRFNSVSSLTSLTFLKCNFNLAPTFSLTPELPQNTRFDGATFVPHAADEHVYRILRIHFRKNGDRDAEGRFYAREKRSQRLGLPFGLTRGVSFLYDKSSEYGYSYARAFYWFCAVQVACCLIYAWLSDRLDFGGSLDSRVLSFTFAQIVRPFELFSGKLPTPGGAYDIVGKQDLGYWLVLSSLQSIVSITLLALFLLALRWRFRRE